MDFIDGLPMSRGVKSILVVVDRMSKYAHFVGLKHPYNASTVAGVFMQEIVRLHEFPASLSRTEIRSSSVIFGLNYSVFKGQN